MSFEFENVTDEDFELMVRVESYFGPVLVNFWAELDDSCTRLTRVLEGLAIQLHDRLKIVRLNIKNGDQMINEFRVERVPSLLLFKDGYPVRGWIGLQTRERLISKLKEFLP